MMGRRKTFAASQVACARSASASYLVGMGMLVAISFPAAAESTFAIRAKCIYPVTAESPGPIYDALLYVRDGKIAAIGRDVEVPANVPVFDRPDAIICPGFVLAGSAIAGQHGGDESVSGAFHAVDGYDPYSENFEELSNGVTTAHLDPGVHRLVSGVGAVVKLAGAADERLLKPASDLQINLGAFNAPPITDVPFFASSDTPIEPSRLQRPQSRLGQMLELRTRIEDALRDEPVEQYSFHDATFARAWREELPIRCEGASAVDFANVLSLLQSHDRTAYFVAGQEIQEIAPLIASARVPLVLRMERAFQSPGANIGPNPEADKANLHEACALRTAGIAPALAGRNDDPHPNPAMIAAFARRDGLTFEQTLAGLTRIPAEILGVSERVGSLKPGADADFLVLSGPPLEITSRVLETFVNGRRVFDATPANDGSIVVRAKKIWLGNGQIVDDGELLIREGKIQSVGHRVAVPPGARIIDATRQGFVTPGFIDSHGHLGLQGDQTVATPDLPIDKIVGVASREFLRVAAAGVTTVMLAPYRTSKEGARIAAIKTFGVSRDELVAREIAGVKIDFAGNQDPLTGIDMLRKKVEAAKKYAEAWKKHEEAFAKWKADKAAGKETKPVVVVDEVVDEKKVDPITGTWEFTLSGGPMPEDVTGTMRLRLNGNQIEGRADVALADEEVTLTGTLEGSKVVLELDQETPVGKPRFEATIDKPDHMTGTLKLGDQFSIDFNATRTSKEQVEFKVSRRKRKSKDGGPIPPKVDEGLEPYRAVLEGKVPLVVDVTEAAQIDAILKLLIDELKLPVVLLNAQEFATLQKESKDRREKIGVIVPGEITRIRERVTYNQAADLAFRGITIAFQSNAEDAARDLPLTALFSVHEGLGGDEALRALTVNAARMYKIDDRIGTLEAGKDADLLIFDGHPMDTGTSLQRVIVNGREVPRTPAKG
ncbi:MAG: amidohydrolase family protein [Phycisphaerae bacterium]